MESLERYVPCMQVKKTSSGNGLDKYQVKIIVNLPDNVYINDLPRISLLHGNTGEVDCHIQMFTSKLNYTGTNNNYHARSLEFEVKTDSKGKVVASLETPEGEKVKSSADYELGDT